MKNYSDIEKSIKRFLKRKVKITLGTIVAFLLSCNFVSAVDYELVITLDKNENILFNEESFDEETHQFAGNTFENNLYTNNSTISGISILKNKNISLNNMGSIINEKYHGIFNNEGTIVELNNLGMISSMYSGIHNLRADINILKNSGIIYGHGDGISITGTIDTLTNKGAILGKASGISIDEDKMEKFNNEGVIYTNNQYTAIAVGDYWNGKEEIGTLSNKGIIKNGNNNGLLIQGNSKIEKLDNIGIISGEGNGIQIYSGSIIDTLNNKGIISGGETNVYYGIRGSVTTSLKNYGIISGGYQALSKGTNYENYGLLINGNKIELGTGKNNLETKDIINGAEIVDGKTVAKAITSSKLSKKENLIINVVGEEKTAFNIDSDTKISNSIINGYKNAIVLKGGKFEGDNIIVNAGENAFIGSENSETFSIFGESIINGKIDLGKGVDSFNLSGNAIINGNISLGGENDSLSLENTVQINGVLDGGEGTEDKLAFTSNSTDSLNILYNIKGFEKTNIDSNVTLFEKTFNDNGEAFNEKITNLSAQLGDITIAEDGNLNLRIDGTEKADGKVIGHALANNVGSITVNGGKLNLKTFGFGEEEIVAFNNTSLAKLEDSDVTVSSVLHQGKVNKDDNTITISAKKDLEDIELNNYEKLNAIYHSLIAENLDKFTVEEEQYGAFTKYLHDIYAANPYAYSAELSRKTMGMMRDIADKDLNPDLKEWAIFGGLTHIDGGTEESYYGKGYYTYDIGSRDISADTKVTGAYVKGEYGKAEDLTLGVILGGNSSETEVENSKVEGDSFYLGGYAKKYLNNFRFTLGAGIHRGDYEADRVAVGYDGITETRKFSENYGDRGFNLYGNVKYSQELGNGFYFEPSVTLDYSYVDQEGVKESGDLAIDIDSEKFDYTSGIVNLDIRKEFVGEKVKHSLIAGVSYERILSGEDEKYITGRFKGGTDFDILVPEKEKDNFALNVKYEVETEKGILFDVKGSYKFENDNNKDQWIVGTGIGYRF